MKLEKAEGGYACGSAPAIRCVRVRKAVRHDGSRGDGWEAIVSRPPQEDVRHVTRTLEEAGTWARRHWRPRFLDNLAAGLEAGATIQALYANSVRGDAAAFFALL